jgi:putative ABC transport system permease protein
VASVITGVESSVPFDYAFLYDRYGVLYRQEKNLGMLMGVFSGLAVLVACLGLLGLATFMTQQRTKEIGIRKVLGASISDVIRLLSREFLILVVLANIIAWPIGYYIMDRWLENFAYKTGLAWYIFMFTGGLALIIAMAAVSFQATRAAYTDPVNALREE